MKMLSRFMIITLFAPYESSWPGVKCRYGGRRQSPIDIRTSMVTMDEEEKFIKYGPLKFRGYDKVLVTGVNNGHTVQFRTEGDISIHPTITGGPLHHTYRMEQLHFHWLSEHAIDGKKFDLEVHFVHIRKDLTVEQALNRRYGIAVMSVFCNVTRADLVNKKTLEYMQYIPYLRTVGSRMSGILLDATTLFSPDLTSYYSYEGSLTSPQCNEVVVWIIFDQPITISNTQYSLFKKMYKGKLNFRQLQPFRLHKVYHTKKVVEPYIPLKNVVSGFYRIVSGLFSKFRS